MMVMEYIKNGCLRQHLNNNFNSLNWKEKLSNIHNKGLIHHDFHGGNILCDEEYSYITDLGLCKPANEKISQDGNKIGRASCRERV